MDSVCFLSAGFIACIASETVLCVHTRRGQIRKRMRFKPKEKKRTWLLFAFGLHGLWRCLILSMDNAVMLCSKNGDGERIMNFGFMIMRGKDQRRGN
jgi:hypothetical protein